MSEQRALFSESWHRVAGQRLRLRPSVTIRKQVFRGETWHIAQDGFTNQFFRFRPEAYQFVARLDGTRTIEEIWVGCLERDGDRAPGQGEIVSMLAQLYQSNLIASDVPADAAQLFQRHQKRVQQEIKSQIFGIFFLRIRLLDPEPILRRLWPVVKWLCTPGAGLLWIVMVGLGLSAVINHWDQAQDQTQSILEPGNLLLLYLGFAMAKLVHEFGHAFAVKKFGGEVHAMGVTLLVFTPIPYVDATAAWAFRERWKRVMVGCAGMIPELFFASIAALVWANTGAGLLNSLAYNVMIVASVSTVIFNINPLLRFDGYYILADLTDSPNLQPRAARQWLHMIEKYAFGGKFTESPARSRKEAVWLSIYGVASWVYRILITVSIILLVADRYFGIGLLAGVVTFIGAFVMPVVGGLRYLTREPRIQRVRKRAWGVTFGALAVIVILLGVVPFPRHFRAAGVVRAAGSMTVLTPVDGWAESFAVPSGTSVQQGAPLVTLQNPELALSIASARANLEQAAARERQMLTELAAGIAPMKKRRESVEMLLAQLEHDQEQLDFRAPVTGEWVSAHSDDMLGTWMARGTMVGELVGDGPLWDFYAVVPQDFAGDLFGGHLHGAEVRFQGSSGRDLRVTDWRVVPGRQDVLPSPALGWATGGAVRVRMDDPRGLRSAEPFFLVVARVPAPTGAAAKEGHVVWHGRTGVIRFDLPWSPLLVQWGRDFRQLLQSHYQL